MVALDIVKDALAVGASILTIVSNTISIVKATYKTWRKPKKSGDLATEDLELGMLSADEPEGSIGAAFATAMRGAIEPMQTRMKRHETRTDRVEEWSRDSKKEIADLQAGNKILETDIRNLEIRFTRFEMEHQPAIPSRPGSPGLRHRLTMMKTKPEP